VFDVEVGTAREADAKIGPRTPDPPQPELHADPTNEVAVPGFEEDPLLPQPGRGSAASQVWSSCPQACATSILNSKYMAVDAASWCCCSC
jgi:hypothetical protein